MKDNKKGDKHHADACLLSYACFLMVEFLVLVVGDVLGLADQVLGVGLVSGAIAFFGQLVVVERVVVLVLIVLEIVQRKIHVLIVVVIEVASARQVVEAAHSAL